MSRYVDDLRRARELLYRHRGFDERTIDEHVNVEHSMVTSVYDEQLAHRITELVERARADEAQPIEGEELVLAWLRADGGRLRQRPDPVLAWLQQQLGSGEYSTDEAFVLADLRDERRAELGID